MVNSVEHTHGMQFRIVSLGTGGMYQSDSISVCRPLVTGRTVL